MREFGGQMDLPGVFENSDEDKRDGREEPISEPVEAEEIAPIIPDGDDERDCPVCGGSGPCSACERGRQQMAEWQKQKKSGRPWKKAS